MAGLGPVVWPCSSPSECDRDCRLVRCPEGSGAYTPVPVTGVTVLNRQPSSSYVSLNGQAPEDLNTGFYFLLKEKAVSDWGSSLHKPPRWPQELGPHLQPVGAEPSGLRGGSPLRRHPSHSHTPTIPATWYILVGSRGAHLLSQLPQRQRW